MHFVLFDEVLETHVVRSLASALRRRGHQVTTTGPIWQGHEFPHEEADVSRIGRALQECLADNPDVLFNFRAATLTASMLEQAQRSGLQTMVWLPDDPVLYQICYGKIVDSYDHVLHCGGEEILDFYEARHGRSGVNFPFWTGLEEWPEVTRTPPRRHDLAFLGNCEGTVRSGRYGFVSSLPFRTQVFGRCSDDPFGISGGYLEGEAAVAMALADASAGLNVPQFFDTYQGSKYDFDELRELGTFQFPSRVIQYACLGLPIVSLQPGGHEETFPELVIGRDRRELIEAASQLLHDPGELQRVASATHDRFLRSFSADARAALLEDLASDPQRWAALSVAERSTAFASVHGDHQETRVRYTPPVHKELRDGQSSHELLPSIDEQRERLAVERIESPRKWKILLLGASDHSLSEVNRVRRALELLGHRVLHLDLLRNPDLSVPMVDASGGDLRTVLSLAAIEPTIDALDPAIIISVGTEAAFTAADADALGARNIVTVGLFLDPADGAGVVSAVAPRFQFVGARSAALVNSCRDAGALHSSVFLPAADRRLLCTPLIAPADSGPDLLMLDRVRLPDQLEAQLSEHFDFGAPVLGEAVEFTTSDGGKAIETARRAGGVQLVWGGDANHEALPAESSDVMLANVMAAAASGAAVCCSNVAELGELFSPGSEVAVVDSAGGLVPALRNLLADPSTIETLRRRSFARICGEHLYEHRLLALFAMVEAEVGQIDGRSDRYQKVVISGYYGMKNVGDEMILDAITSGASKQHESVYFVVAAENPIEVERSHALEAFDRSDLERSQVEVADASAVLLGGGGLWHDYSFERAGRESSLFADNRISPTGYAKVPLLGAIHHRPFHVYGMGAGPLGEPAKRFVKFVADRAATLTVRDESSKTLLEAYPTWTAPITVAPDPVYALDIGEPGTLQTISDLARSGPVLGVNLRPWASDDVRLHENVAAALERFAATTGCSLVGVPMREGSAHDSRVLERVFSMVDSSVDRVILDYEDPLTDVVSALAACDVVLSMRLHSCLLAHRLGVPVAGLAYDPKLDRHFEDLGVGGDSLPLTSSADAIYTKLVALLEPADMAALDAAVRDRETAAHDSLAQLGDALAASPDAFAVAPLCFTGSSGNPRPSSGAPSSGQREIDLRSGTIRSGCEFDTGEVPFVAKRSPNQTMFHIDRSDPKRGDFVEFEIAVSAEAGSGQWVVLEVVSPYARPKNTGRLQYEVWLDDMLLLTEDVAQSDAINEIRIAWLAKADEARFRVRVIALRDCESWSWGRQGRLELRRITHGAALVEDPLTISASSPHSALLVDR